ncbi:MAG: ATP-binding protein [Micromonosporaceae bacterium]|nr:ATP-binding protein [Micromonosporaceae bacterium]
MKEVTLGVHDSLQRDRSALVTETNLDEELENQIRCVLLDVHDAIVGLRRDPTRAENTVDDQSPARSRAPRAECGAHPMESLRVATVLFEVALPVLAREYSSAPGVSTLAISRILHQTIMARVVTVSLSYVSFLLAKLHASRQEERRRIARELHDRVLHSMGVARQQLDLHSYHADRQPAVAAEKVAVAAAQLHEAVRTVQSISAELRRCVGAEGLEQALMAYLTTHTDPGLRVAFSTVGDARRLLPEVVEDLYLTLREAVRNALRHAKASVLEIAIEVTDQHVVASVSDDGCGFDVGHPPIDGGGMPSMRERMQILRGTMTVSSVPGAGTTVTVRVPLTGAML